MDFKANRHDNPQIEEKDAESGLINAFLAQLSKVLNDKWPCTTSAPISAGRVTLTAGSLW